MIDLDVRGRATTTHRDEKSKLLRRLQRAMQAAGEGDSELSLSLVDDDEIQVLNREWRREDHATDVLSFSLSEGEAPNEIPGMPRLLGDIVISVETAARQANEAERPLDAELLHLAVHGLAHLLGYDHATPDEERIMFAWETRLRTEATSRTPVKPVRRP